MIDVVEEVNAARRQVGTRSLEAGEGRTVTIARSYAAPIDDLWDACTNPERIPRWFLPVAGELRQGGRFQLEGNAGGTIERCDPPRSFAATWEYGGDVSWIEVRLSAEPDGRTRFELEHTSAVSDHWREFGPGATGVGWDLGLLGLGLHLGSGEPVRPKEFQLWTQSDDGRRFMTLSSRAWGEAHVASGEEEAAARAAADRTAVAYTAGV